MTDPAQDPHQAAAAAAITSAITATDYQGFDRRKEYREWRSNVDQRLDDGADTMRGLRKDIAANTAMTKGIQEDTSELVDLLRSFKGALKVLDALGRLARPLGYIVALVGGVMGLVAFFKGGLSPK